VHTNFRVTNPLTGASIALDSGDMRTRQTKIEDTSFGGSSDFLIGYRLSKITFRKNSAQEFTPKLEKYTQGNLCGGGGAMLGWQTFDDNIRTFQSTLSIAIEVKEAIEKDFAASALRPVAAVDEDHNTECQCVMVPLIN